MKRVLFPILAILAVTGCATTPPADNPFLGPATVPPPGTGAAGAATQPAPYYPPVPQSGSVPFGSGSRYGPATGAYSPSVPEVERTKVAAVDGKEDRASSSVVARGTAQDRLGGSGDQAVAAVATGADHVANGTTRTPADSGNEASDGIGSGSAATVTGGSKIRIVEPEPRSDAATLASTGGGQAQEPRRFEPATPLIDINELPAASGTSSPQAPRVSQGSGRDDSSALGGAEQAFATSAAYGHDQNYAWLKGKLERSRVDGRWKLRYIPIDGDTDRFGGSVVLGDSPLLEGYKPGQFVAVEGDLGNNKPADYGFAPSYAIHRVAALDR